MAKNGLKLALPFTLGFEGGYSNHQSDPGGSTFQGVTQTTYDAYRRNKGVVARSVREMVPAERTAIYDKQYWQVVKGADLPAGLDFAVFDFAVNSGCVQAIKELQRAVGAGVDGHIGEETLAAVCLAASNDEEGLITRYCNRRLDFMSKLKNWKTFKRGWTRRVMGATTGFQDIDNGVVDLAVMIARKDLEFGVTTAAEIKAATPAPMGAGRGEIVASAKADPSKVAVLKTSEGRGFMAAMGGVGSAGVGVLGTVAKTASENGDKVQVISETTGKVVNVYRVAKPILNTEVLLLLIVFLLLIVATVGIAYFAYTVTQRHREKTSALEVRRVG